MGVVHNPRLTATYRAAHDLRAAFGQCEESLGRAIAEVFRLIQHHGRVNPAIWQLMGSASSLCTMAQESKQIAKDLIAACLESPLVDPAEMPPPPSFPSLFDGHHDQN